jgi:signal transduction histidine kinase
VRRALEEARAMVQSSLAPAQRVEVELGAASGEGGDLAVLADPARLRQVLLNLLRNAAHYSPAGSTIRLGAAGDTGRARGVHLWVADEGVGLTAEECERVFERFWRGPLAVTSGRPGAGLGLSICRGLAEAMGGRIWAESAGPGRGATFHLVLPRAGGR